MTFFWYQLISREWLIWVWTLFPGVRIQRSGSWILMWSAGYTGGSLHITRVRSPSSIFLHIQEGQESRGINALVQRWTFKKKYAFSPPQLILYKYAWQSRPEWCDRYDVSKTRPSVGEGTCLWQPWRFINLPLLRLWTLWGPWRHHKALTQ